MRCIHNVVESHWNLNIMLILHVKLKESNLNRMIQHDHVVADLVFGQILVVCIG